MCTLNQAGAAFAQLEGVTGMTDVTGFGLIGHLLEVCEGSGVDAEIDFEAVPLLPHVKTYLAEGCTFGGTQRNFNSYGHKVSPLSEEQKYLLCDPQTSGGLLVAVKADKVATFLDTAAQCGLSLQPIGRTLPHQGKQTRITVR